MALRPSDFIMSTGMPRPLSVTVAAPSSCMMICTSSAKPARPSSMALSMISVMQLVVAVNPGAALHIHAGAFADRFQALEDTDLTGVIFLECFRGQRSVGQIR